MRQPKYFIILSFSAVLATIFTFHCKSCTLTRAKEVAVDATRTGRSLAVEVKESLPGAMTRAREEAGAWKDVLSGALARMRENAKDVIHAGKSLANRVQDSGYTGRLSQAIKSLSCPRRRPKMWSRLAPDLEGISMASADTGVSGMLSPQGVTTASPEMESRGSPNRASFIHDLD